MNSRTGSELVLGQHVIFRNGQEFFAGILHGFLDGQAAVRTGTSDIFQHIEPEDMVHAVEAFESLDQVGLSRVQFGNCLEELQTAKERIVLLEKQFANCQDRLDDAINASILRDGGVSNSRMENNPEFPGLGAPETAPETPLNDPAAAETGEAGAEVTQPSAALGDAVPAEPSAPLQPPAQDGN